MKAKLRSALKKPIWIIIFFSIIVHIVVLTQLNWTKSEKEKEEIIEVELVPPVKSQIALKKPERRVPPKKPPPPAPKPRAPKVPVPKAPVPKAPVPKAPVPSPPVPNPPKAKRPMPKPPTRKVPTARAPITGIPSKKPQPPAKPLSSPNGRPFLSAGTSGPALTRAKKPSLALKPDLQTGTRNNNDSRIGLGNRELKIPKIGSAGKPPAVPETLPEVTTTERQIPERKSSVVPRSTNLNDVDVGQIAPGSIKGDIETGIRDQNDTPGYRIVKKSKGPGGNEKTRGPASSQRTQGTYFVGEIKQRKVIFKPEPPEMSIDRDVTIVLKFTVLPNGTVDQIFSSRMAQPELEHVAMKLLQQYRFEPLFENAAVQNGIIHFTIHRKK